ncbi:MAG: glycoside hydrolase family 2 TIM barrel-domain containing protein, partial [Candidatus Omnitrophota bacterium]
MKKNKIIRADKVLTAVVITAVSTLLGLTLLAQGQDIQIKTTSQKGYYLSVKGKPFLVKGVIYNPTPICQGYEYEFLLDKNAPWLVDGKLMKKAGINCVRIYSAGADLEKTRTFIRDMYEKFGIYTIVSDWLGLWTYPGVNYADEQFQKATKERVLNIVSTLKNEKGLLMWVLGNENSYTFSGKICFWTTPEIEKIPELRKRIERKAEIYYTFVNELAGEVKKIDPLHPVALGNGEESFLDIAAKVSPNIDVLAIVAYKGKKFGNQIFHGVPSYFNRPILISEFGCDSYDSYKDKEDQVVQSEFVISQWRDIFEHTAVSGFKEGKCIGGTLFEWSDEWWKHNEGYTPDWCVHNKEAGWSNGSYFFDIKAPYGLNISEEWFGIVSLQQEKK